MIATLFQQTIEILPLRILPTSPEPIALGEGPKLAANLHSERITGNSDVVDAELEISVGYWVIAFRRRAECAFDRRVVVDERKENRNPFDDRCP